MISVNETTGLADINKKYFILPERCTLKIEKAAEPMVKSFSIDIRQTQS